jgi:hypothetical protein
MVKDDKVLYVVRGARDSLDPTYACAAHNNQKGRYAMIEVDTDKGTVTGRTMTNSVHEVEAEAASYRGVYMDTRPNNSLVKLPVVKHAQSADLDLIRRAKSDVELDVLNDLSNSTRKLLEHAKDEYTFRGSAHGMGNRAYFRKHVGKGFTEYRGGMKDSMGRCSDLTRIVPHTTAWRERMNRVHHGLDEVTRSAVAGAPIEKLDAIFKGCLDSRKDIVASSCVHSTGYESVEKFKDFSVLKPYDFVTVGVAVTDGQDTALVYRGTKQIKPPSAPVVVPTVRNEGVPPAPPALEVAKLVPRSSLHFRGVKPTQAIVPVVGMNALERAFI